MSAASIQIFVSRLYEMVDGACEQAAKLGVERTVLNVLNNDVRQLGGELTTRFPVAESTLEALPDDVIALQHLCEDLHETNVHLRHQLDMQENKTSDLVRRMTLRDNVLNSMRKQAATALLPNKGPLASVELITAVEMESAFAQSRAEDMIRRCDSGYQRALERQKNYFQRIIDAKEREIIQLQLQFRNTLSGIQVSHAANLQELGQRFSGVREQLASANQTATIRAAEEFSAKLRVELGKAEGEYAELMQNKQREVDDLQISVDQGNVQLQLLEEENHEMGRRLLYAQHALQHVLLVELPFLSRQHQQQYEDSAATNAEQKERDSEKISELLHMQRQFEAKTAQDIAALNSQLSAAAREIASKEARLREMETAKLELFNELSRYKSQISELQAQLDAALQKLQKRSAETAMTATTAGQWSEKMQSLRKEKDEQIAALRIELMDAQRDHAASESMLSKCRSELSTLHSNAEKMKKEAREYRDTDIQTDEDEELINANALRKRVNILAEELLSIQAERSFLRRKLSGSRVLHGSKHPSANTSQASIFTDAPEKLRGASPPQRVETAHHEEPVTAERPSTGHDVVEGMPTVQSEATLLAHGHEPSGSSPLSENEMFTIETRSCECQTVEPLIFSSPAVEPSPAVPVVADFPVQCELFSFDSRQQEAPSMREMASVDDRAANAKLRVELVELRMKLQGTSESNELLSSMELQPIPLSFPQDVSEQNMIFSNEVDRRQEYFAAQRLAPHGPKVTETAQSHFPVPEVEASHRVNIVNIPALHSHAIPAAFPESDEPFITAMRPQDATAPLSAQQQQLQAQLRIRSQLPAHQAELSSGRPHPPSSSPRDTRDTVSLVDYQKQVICLPFSNIMPVTSLRIDAAGHEIPTTPHAFRRRPHSARPMSRASRNAPTSATRPESRAATRLGDAIDPAIYFNVTSMMKGGKAVASQMAAAAETTEPARDGKVNANIVVSSYVPCRPHHSGYTDPPAKTVGEVMRKRAAAREQWPTRVGTFHPIRRADHIAQVDVD